MQRQVPTIHCCDACRDLRDVHVRDVQRARHVRGDPGRIVSVRFETHDGHCDGLLRRRRTRPKWWLISSTGTRMRSRTTVISFSAGMPTLGRGRSRSLSLMARQKLHTERRQRYGNTAVTELIKLAVSSQQVVLVATWAARSLSLLPQAPQTKMLWHN